MLRFKTRPEHVFTMQDDENRHCGGAVVAGFRVHYRHDTEMPNRHYTTPVLWEWEARDFIDTISQVPGVEFVARDNRPEGVETVLGYASDRENAGRFDPDSFWFRRARTLSAYLDDPAEMTAKVIPFILSAPERLREALFAAMAEA